MTITQLQVPVVKSNINSGFPIFFPPNQIEDQQYKENFSERGGSHYVIYDSRPKSLRYHRKIPMMPDESRTQSDSTISSQFSPIWRKEVALSIRKNLIPPPLQVELTVFKLMDW